MLKKIGVMLGKGLKVKKSSKVIASVGIFTTGAITAVTNHFDTTAEEYSADNGNGETITTEDVQAVRRSNTELERFVGNTEDSDSVIDVEDTEETKEVEEVEEVEEVDEVQDVEENIEENEVDVVDTEVDNAQNLAVESNQLVQTTPTNNNTTSSGNNSTPTQRVEHATNNSADAERQAQERAQREANKRAAAEKAAAERAQREAAERAAQERAAQERAAAEKAAAEKAEAERRAAEEAERKRAESLKIHSRALYLNGQPVGQNARGDIWFFQGELNGAVEYQNDSGVRRHVSVKKVIVDSNFIGVNDGVNYKSEASGAISPVVVTQLADGNIMLQILR